MAEMLISTPEVKKTVSDYDFIFTSGMILPFTIDQNAGDKMIVGDRVILIHLASKPSMKDPAKMLPSEDITVFTQHVISIQQRERELTELSPAQRLLWEKTLQEVSGTVQ